MILKHRDRELLRFEWTESGGVRILSLEESNRKFLPIEFGVAAGKGHEDYQIIGKEKRHFDEKEIVKEIFDAVQA
mgnify:CR=1 FL=1